LYQFCESLLLAESVSTDCMTGTASAVNRKYRGNDKFRG